jgi:tetratricopeptide (TPR) repeat protein
MKLSCHTILRSMLFMLAVFIFSANDLQAHVDHGNTPDAIAAMEYRILLEFEPDNIEARNKLAMVLYRLDKLDEALLELQRVLELAPDNFDALETLGLVSFKQGKTQQALKYFEAAVRINSEDILVHYHLGLVQGKLGLLDAAETSLVTALTRYKELNDQTGTGNEIDLIEKALAEVRARQKEKK